MISPPLKVYVSGFPFLSCHNGWYTLKNEKTYVKDEALFETKIINSYTTYIRKPNSITGNLLKQPNRVIEF